MRRKVLVLKGDKEGNKEDKKGKKEVEDVNIYILCETTACYRSYLCVLKKKEQKYEE